MLTATQIGEAFGGRYKIIEKLGDGSTSSIYKAEHLSMNVVVAIKVLKPEHARVSVDLQRFMEEAKAGAGASHPGLCQALDFGITNEGVAFIVMELCAGETLDQLIRKDGSVSVPSVLAIFGLACDALEHLHRAKVIHRGLNPTDIVAKFDQFGNVERVKIIDFGYCKHQASTGRTLVHAGEVFGRAFYMSPEQFRGQSVDARSDIYSLGCTMYEAITGVVPFEGTSFIDTADKHINQTAPPFSERCSFPVPKDVEAVVFKALEKDPARRFQSMDEMNGAILNTDQGRNAMLHTATKSQPTKKKWWPW